MRERLPGWVSTLVTILGGMALVVVVLVFGVWLLLLDGFGDLTRGPRPSEDDPTVLAARQEGEEVLGARVERFRTGTLGDALGHSNLVAIGDGHRCDVGQHNWKVDDPFDLRCFLVRSIAVETDLHEFRTDVFSLHDQLVEAGWDDWSLDGLPGIVTEYFDRNHGDVFERPSGEVDRYTVSDLPGAYYRRSDSDAWSLSVGWTDPVDPQEHAGTVGGVPWWATFSINGREVDATHLAAELGPDTYGLVVSITYRYFSE